MSKKGAKDPRLSLDADPNTGVVGLVPSYQSLKLTYKEKVRPFMSQMGPSQSQQEGGSPVPIKIDWSKVTDPKQSIRILD